MKNTKSSSWSGEMHWQPNYLETPQQPQIQIKVIDYNNSDNFEDWTVECPNCGRHVNYGKEIFTVGGFTHCSDPECEKQVHEKYMHIFNKHTRINPKMKKIYLNEKEDDK